MNVTGVLHMHSTHSYDGKLSLSELKDFLIAKDISFCCMTEHTDQMTDEGSRVFVEECRKLSDEKFIFIPGFEVPYLDAHILHIGATEFLGQFADTERLFAWRKVAPLVILAHPVRNHFKLDDAMLEVVDGIEVWNQQYEGKSAPRTHSVQLLAQLQKKKKLLATGGLDFHRKEHFGSPLYTLEIATLSEESILHALKTGQYTFGNATTVITSTGEVQKGSKLQLRSLIDVSVITGGKLINKTLAGFGLSLPSSLKKAVRSKF